MMDCSQPAHAKDSSLAFYWLTQHVIQTKLATRAPQQEDDTQSEHDTQGEVADLRYNNMEV
jgi:hypothetical protein